MEVNNILAAGLDPTRSVAAARVNAPQPTGSTGFKALVDKAGAVNVWDEVDAAAKVAQDLHARGRELHFAVANGGRLSIEVRDLDGHVLRSVPSRDAIEIAAGKGTV